MPEQTKNPIAQALTALRNKKLTAEQRSAIAKKAAEARWGEGKAPAKKRAGKRAGK